MMMTKKEWELHCVDTGCTMSYEKYVKAVDTIMQRLKK